MKVPVSWLREYVSFDTPVDELAKALVFTSFEVDRVVRRGVSDLDGNLGLFRVGKVLQAGKHPNADRLQLCQVDVGEGDARQIVCGAWNFGAGATVAVALPGARLPGADEPLGEAKLRGELSRGMILSERELELGSDHTGIIVLEDGPEPGTPLGDVLPLVEDVLEIETAFNRPDLMAIYGIAREVAVVMGGELAPVPGRDPELAGEEPVDVRIEDFDGCPRYVGRLFRGASVGHAPIWMKARLLAAGMRPISNVVDVTNYVMLALGSPLHAFDRARLDEGRIVVRHAAPGEELRTLDGTVRVLVADDLVIADARRPVAIAGIMGGEDSEVADTTTEILLEAANFDPLVVLRTSRRLRLRTESSTRWEKGVDPHAAAWAATYASQLLAELAGARWVGETDVRGEVGERPVVRHEPVLVGSLSGMDIPLARAHLACPGRHPLRRPGGGGRPLPHGGRALDASDQTGDVRPTHPRAAAPQARGGCARRGGLPRGVHVVVRSGGRGADRAARAVLGRAGRTAHRPRARAARVGPPQRERGRRARRALRARARLPADGR
jgi:phenylalanyl-tRNA synthetase beta chain